MMRASLGFDIHSQSSQLVVPMDETSTVDPAIKTTLPNSLPIRMHLRLREMPLEHRPSISVHVYLNQQ